MIFSKWNAVLLSLVIALSVPAEAAPEKQLPPPGYRIHRSIPPQGAKTHVIVPGERFRAGGFKRWLYGSDYRDLWTTPIEVAVLDLNNVGGGLTPPSHWWIRTVYIASFHREGWSPVYGSFYGQGSQQTDVGRTQGYDCRRPHSRCGQCTSTNRCSRSGSADGSPPVSSIPSIRSSLFRMIPGWRRTARNLPAL